MIPRKNKDHRAEVEAARQLVGNAFVHDSYFRNALDNLANALEFVQGERDYWKQQCELARKEND